ncbi:hypothetical protein QUF99_16620 [Bacillus sp. DX4.1]|nr:hypothetical protein [Bacillus sp. DX4.1]MDM5188881.1 hypothetical protein [Bacillus sp. DX4.1]
MRFEFFSSVGVLELDSCRIVVKPKFHNGFHDVIQMVLFTEDIPLSIEHDTKGGHDAESLYELLVRLYIKQVEMILERGVTKEYINEENNLNVLRGRLNMRKQLQLNYSRPTKIYCHYDELETNILDNQVLRSVLEVARRLPLTKSTARRVQQLLHEFTNLTDLFHHTEWPRFTYNRLNQHYEYAHKLGYYIWQQQYTNQMYQFSSDSHFSFFIDMNELFEAFVGKWLEQYTPPTTKVHLQKFFKKAMISNETSYHNIKPDIIIETPNEPALVIDTKYKNYGNKKVSNSDIYQLAFYGQFLQKENKPYRAMILYPRYTGEDAKEEVIELLPGTDYAGRLFVRAVPVEKLIEEIKHKNNDYLFDVAARTLSIRMS